MKSGLNAEQKRWIAGLTLCALAIALPIGALTIRGYLQELALRDSSSSACASVDERRVSGRRRDHEARYHFEVGGERYTHGDATGAENLWATIREDEGLRGECVEVVYVASNPAINRPRSGRTKSAMGKLGGLVLVLLTLLLFGSGVVGILRVARTTLWRIEELDAESLTLVSGEARVKIERYKLRRCILLQRPRSPRHPPWRFESDVLVARTKSERWTIEPVGPHWGALLRELSLESKLKRKNAS